MLVGIDVKCMHTNFGECSLSGFGDIATFKNGQISLSDHGLYVLYMYMYVTLLHVLHILI